MGKLAHSNEATMDEIEQRSLFQRDEGGYRMSDKEAFEILFDADVSEIKWDSALNAEFVQWQYFNIK
jgi:hypothetical protein